MEHRTLVTIVTESVLEKKLADDLVRLGAHGYTVVEASGAGERGIRGADWEQTRNIRAEVVRDATVARSIVDHLRTTYLDRYAMIVYTTDVQVLRSEKF
jgi:nitrogen regulatory protein PII